MEVKNISSITRQIVWSGLADFITNSNSDDIIGLLKSNYGLIGDLGKEILTKDEINRLRIFNYKINYYIKPYLEGLKKKHLIEEDINSEKFREYKKGLAKCGLINLDVYTIFYKLLKQTILINQSIPNQDIIDAKKKYFMIKLEDEMERKLYFRHLKKEEETLDNQEREEG